MLCFSRPGVLNALALSEMGARVILDRIECLSYWQLCLIFCLHRMNVNTAKFNFCLQAGGQHYVPSAKVGEIPVCSRL